MTALLAVAVVAAFAGPSHAAKLRKADLSASKRAAFPGARVKLEGRRFPPRASIVLRFGGKRLRALRTRRSGRFRASFRVPQRPAGVYRLEARARTRGFPRRRRVAKVRFRIAEGAPRPGTISPAPAKTLAPAATYTNPVFGESASDPMALRAGSADYYGYFTGSLFPVLRSRDLVHWSRAPAALAARPSWVGPTGDSHPWAPSVLRSGQACPGAGAGPCYFLYYVGLSGQHTPSTHCIGVARSSAPGGPFDDRGPVLAEGGGLDASGRPPGCGDDAGYSNIDPAPFVDVDGRTYLYVTTNRRCTTEPPGQACSFLPTISVIPLAADLTHASGARSALFGGAAGTWEQQGTAAPVVENPWVERRPNGRYYLFYSGGSYQAAYGMGYATASAPMGDAGPIPFAKSASNPILKEAGGVLSPGGGSVVLGPHGGDWLVYHGRAGGYDQPRTLRIDSVVWGSGGGVSIAGPTSTPRSPVP